MRVLVVEDNYLIAMMICEALLDAGYVVIGPAPTAGVGLKLVEVERPDLALLNVDLADEIKGTYLARVLYNQHRIPILFVSGNVDEMRAAKDVALGYISKPCSPATVVESVEIAKAIVRGERPDAALIPDGLTLFGV